MAQALCTSASWDRRMDCGIAYCPYDRGIKIEVKQGEQIHQKVIKPAGNSKSQQKVTTNYKKCVFNKHSIAVISVTGNTSGNGDVGGFSGSTTSPSEPADSSVVDFLTLADL